MNKNGKYSNGGKFAGLAVKRLQLPVSSPACYSPSRQTIYINPPTFDILSNRAQDFVMCHEAGHAQNESEFGADWAGFLRFLRMGYTPKDAIEAVNESLSMSSPQQQQRFLALIYRAACYDAEVNNNPKTLNLIMSNPEFEQFTDSDIRLFARRAGISEDDAADFLGMSEEKKAAKAKKKADRQAKKDQKAANKQAKTDAKLAKQQAKTEVILSRANKNNAKAEGIANGTYQGAGAAIKDTLGSAINTIGGIFGANSGAEDEEDYEDVYGGSTETKIAAAETGNSKMKWLLIAAAVIIAVVVVVIIVKKRKK